MADIKIRFHIPKKLHLHELLMLLLGLLVFLLLVFNRINSNQVLRAVLGQVRFEGEYCIGDGEWQKIVEGQHISSTKSDVTLRGHFHLFSPDGEYVGLLDGDLPIALYTDHINLTFCEGENEPFVIDRENSMYGVSACGVD